MSGGGGPGEGYPQCAYAHANFSPMPNAGGWMPPPQGPPPMSRSSPMRRSPSSGYRPGPHPPPPHGYGYSRNSPPSRTPSIGPPPMHRSPPRTNGRPPPLEVHSPDPRRRVRGPPPPSRQHGSRSHPGRWVEPRSASTTPAAPRSASATNTNSSPAGGKTPEEIEYERAMEKYHQDLKEYEERLLPAYLASVGKASSSSATPQTQQGSEAATADPNQRRAIPSAARTQPVRSRSGGCGDRPSAQRPVPRSAAAGQLQRVDRSAAAVDALMGGGEPASRSSSLRYTPDERYEA